MSNYERRANLPAIIKSAEPTFTDLAKRHNVPDFTFAREAEFAIQILKQNDYLSQIACDNPDSLKDAIINVAAIGLSLSPIRKQAYLVPRKKRVCLDISYQGFVDLATSRGAILWAKAELVRDKDQFEFMGMNMPPKHKIKNVFGDRGAVIGGYCTAKMPTGDLLVDIMALDEIYAIRDRSEAWKAYKAGTIKTLPWVTDENEMMKKTLIRRAYKSWPKTASQYSLKDAIGVVDDTDGLDSESGQVEAPDDSETKRQDGFADIRKFLEALDRPESAYIDHLNRATNRKIGKLEDLTNLEIEQQIVFLEGVVDAQAAKLERLKSKGAKDE